MKLYFVTVFISLSLLQFQAQSFIDLSTISYELSPSHRIIEKEEKSSLIEKGNFKILIPFELDSSNILLAGIDYGTLQIDNLDLSNLNLQIGWQKKWSEKSKSTLLLIPKLSSDFQSIGEKDFQLGGVFLLSNHISSSFYWKYGVYANSDRFGLLTVPLLGFKWQASPNLQIDATLPVSATIRKTASEQFMYGITYSGRAFSYHLSDSESYLQVADNNVWAFADIYLRKSIVINLKAGHSVLREYGIYQEGDQLDISFGPFDIGDDRQSSPIAFSQGFSFQGALIWRYAY